MDYHHQNIQTRTSLKKFTQFILSVYVFSFLFSYSSWYSFFLNSFKHSSLYVFPSQLLAHTLDKNMIFLICNGILVFLAKTSGLLCSRSRFDINDTRWIKKYGDQEIQIEATAKELSLENQVLMDSTNPISPLEAKIEDKDELEQEEINGSTFIVENDEENDKDSESCFAFEDDEEEEDEDDKEEEDEEERREWMGLLSTEELNKKFDEFIRKMKEDLRIQAQQQLIMV